MGKILYYNKAMVKIYINRGALLCTWVKSPISSKAPNEEIISNQKG